MANVVDELLITLGIDASKFEKGQREADDSLRKVKDRAVKQSEEIEGGNTDVADAFAKITTEAAIFFAALAAFNAAKDLIIKVNRSNSALGRFSTNIGMTPQQVSEWGMAVERMGGSADDAQGSINSMSKALYDLHTQGGNIPLELRRLSALSNVNIDTEHGVSKFMNDIAAAAQKLSKTDMTQTHFLLQGAGIDDNTANTMIKYGAGMSDYLKSLEKYAPSPAAIKAAQDLNASFAATKQAVKSLGSDISADLDPELTKVTDSLHKWIDDNKDLEANDIVKWLEGVGERLEVIAKVAKARIDEFDAVVEFLESVPSPAGEAYRAIKRGPPKQAGSGEATPIPWGKWWRNSERYLKRRAGEIAVDPFGISAHAGELSVAGTNNPHRPPLHLPAHPHTLTPSGGARLSMLAGPQAVASRSTTRNIASLRVKGTTAQEIADNLVAGIRAELTA